MEACPLVRDGLQGALPRPRRVEIYLAPATASASVPGEALCGNSLRGDKESASRLSTESEFDF